MSQTKKRVYVKQPVEKRIETACRKGCLLLAKSMPAAVRKLTDLLDDENPEIARKAGVDLIKLQLAQPKSTGSGDTMDTTEPLDAELADRLLKALAGDT